MKFQGSRVASKAPYDDKKIPVMVDVCVSITMHKNVKVCISDYDETNYGLNEDGDIDIERKFNPMTLANAVKEQIELPQEKVKGWSVDEFEVIED